jgi:hypothetical protein
LAPPAGSLPLSRWAWGPLSIPYKSGTPTYKLQVKIRSETCIHASPHVLQHRTLPPSQSGLRAATCLVAPDPGSHLPDRKGSGAATCTVAPDPTSLQGRVPVRHISYSSRSCLPAGEGSKAPHVLRLLIMPPYREGSGAATACRAASYGPRDLNVKKNLAVLLVQLGLHVLNTRAHVSKVSGPSWACKTCRQAVYLMHVRRVDKWL